MPRKRLDPRRVKIHRSYSIEEAARALDVHKQTVRNWIKDGLPVMIGKRPQLIAGDDLRRFLQRRRASGKHPCGPGELFCLRCRSPREAAAGMIDYLPMTSLSGNLRAICPVCDALMHRRVSLSKLDEVAGSCVVAFPQGYERLRV